MAGMQRLVRVRRLAVKLLVCAGLLWLLASALVGRPGRDQALALADWKHGFPSTLLLPWQPPPPLLSPLDLPGEGGVKVKIPKEKQQLKKEKFKINQFNLLVSRVKPHPCKLSC